MEWFDNLDTIIENLINWMGMYGPLFGSLLMCVESILPILPLSLFITLNFLAFGSGLGFIISWICTLIGCCMSFLIFRKGLQRWFEARFRIMNKVDSVMNFIDNATFSQLVMVIAMPFTPAFLLNIGAGLSKLEFKRFLLALIIGKGFMVYFWGIIGTSLLESLKDPVVIVKVIVIMLVAYLASKYLNKKFKLN